jgi:nicotinamidase-related amidase
MTTALLIIDVQQALCSGEWAVFEASRVIDRINHVTQLARDAGAPVVYIQHEESEGPMVHGGNGWQLDPRLHAQPADLYVRKQTCDSFHNTDLQTLLQARGITKLVACGLQSEFCVDSTVRRALALGYPVTLVEDGHSTMDSGGLTAAQITAHHNTTLSNMQSFGTRVQVVPADQVRFVS